MKTIYIQISLFFLLISCTTAKKEEICKLSDFPVDTIHMEHHLLGEHMIFPTGLETFGNHIVFMDDNTSNGIYHFFSNSTFEHVFSDGQKGHAKDEFIYPLHNFFETTDSSFRILDFNSIREFKVVNKKLVNIGNFELPVHTINQPVHVANDEYIMEGFTDGENEHIKVKDGNISEFGVFPDNFDNNNWIRNRKLTAGIPSKDFILDFYVYHNRVRMYNSDGTLFKDIIVKDDISRTSLSSDITSLDICFYRINYNSDYIIAVYGLNNNKKEIQLWTWDGELYKRLHTDDEFSLICLAENNIIYAIDNECPNVLLSYNIMEKSNIK